MAPVAGVVLLGREEQFSFVAKAILVDTCEDVAARPAHFPLAFADVVFSLANVFALVFFKPFT